jgi:hypothetical protein
MEIWKDIEAERLEGCYQISNLGRVKSIKSKERILKPKKEKNGYLNINLSKNNKYKTRRIHRLVLEAFVGECPEGMEAMHLDNNRANPELTNLKWGTRSENQRQRAKDGTSYRGERGGESHPAARLKEREVCLIKKLLKHKIKQKIIAKIFKVSRGHISNIKLNRNWDGIVAYI